MKKINLELYKKMYLIRKTEERLCQLYPQDELKTPLHMSIGEEAIAAGVCTGLRQEDQVFGTYRSHGIYLAKTNETDKFFAELYGKASGLAKGKSGSMHLSSPESGFLGASSIVASIIPVGAGAAFANKFKGNGKVVAVFFGDGAVDEGDFWETLNAACVMKLPLMFVYEDNDFAVHTHKSIRHGYSSITKIVAQFNCSVFSKVTTDVEEIYNLTCKARQALIKLQKPVFIDLHYYRYLEHVGINEDFNCGYRSKKEFEKWLKKDPVKLQRKKMLRLGINEAAISEAEKRIEERIDNSIRLAKEAPFPEDNELCKDLYI